MKLCTTCWDDEALQGSQQCLRCQQLDPFAHKDYGWAQPWLPRIADDLTPALMELLDKLAAAEAAAET